MTPERWQHLKRLLHAVLARKPEERDAFLAEVCREDETLREDLESLLAHEAQANSFIEEPAFGVMADTLTNEHAMSMLGRTLGRYRIVAALGSGGMGEVYVAEDTQLGRKIALKTLAAHFTIDDERVRRFQQEARAASALNHPNIITIYEIGQIDSRHFIITEFIEGETLRQRMAKTPMVISEALDVATQVASALATAHHEGIVHRDIKPENIMLRADGIAKVLDFGLAKLTEQKSLTSDSPPRFETAPGAVMGTAHYMSPEQARGLSVDARTDIWSLGVVLFEMVAGRVPFEGTTSSDVISSILDREPATLARYSPDAPTELEWIVKKALRKDREERYQTAKELLSDLKALKRRLEFEQDLERSAHSGPQSIYSRHVSAEAELATSQSRKSPREVVESLAILPMVNKCADPNMDYLSDGITESIINALSRLTQLRVMAWSTVSRYKGKEIDPRDIGTELNVRAVLTGRMMQLGEQLTISTELVDVVDGSHLWGESYRCQAAEILDIGAEISSEMSEKLLLRLTTEERRQLTKRYTDNVEAYHAYLRGRYCWNKRSDEGIRKAIEHFNQAIDNDPGYALAYCGLADSYLVLGSFGIATMSPRDAFPKARAAALRALEIDDTLAEAHASLAFSLTNYDWNWPAAEREFKRCFELKPGYATAHHWFGFTYLTAVGHLNQAIAEARQALKLDPLSLPVSANVGLLLYLARRYDEAIDQLQQTLELDQNFCYSHWQLALAYEQKQMYDEAIAGFQRAISLSGRSELPKVLLGHAYAVSGRKSEALAVLDQLSRLPKQRYVSPYRIAAIHAGLQDKDRAFQWLERAYEDRDGWLIWLHLDPVMEGISSDKRFTDLLHRVVPARSANSEMTGPPRAARAPEIARESSAGAPFRSTLSRPWPVTRQATIIMALGLIALLSAMAYLLLQRSNRTTEDVAAPKAQTFMQLTHQPGPEFFPSLSLDGESFAYASRTSGNWDIYVQRVGGANPINLTHNSLADDTQPAFSPAGDRIAFRSERDGGGIFLMGVSGEPVVRLTDFGYSAAWSPDGQQIFVGTEKIPQPSTRPSKSQLWAINTRTNERRLITEGDALQPNCSPHGNRIAFWSRPSKTGQRDRIWTIPAEGGEAVAVTAGTVSDSNPVWSPDGKFLYFSSNRGGSVNIWRVPIDEKSGVVLGEPDAVTTIGAATSALYLSFSRDGRRLAYIAQEEIRNLRKVSFDPDAGKVALAPVSITRGSMQLWFPDVSPDGEWLTCQSMGNQRHIFIMRTDGSEVRNLTDDTFRHFWPRWSPDGKRIAFSSRRSGNYEIWSINRDGSGLQQLTRDHGSPGAHYSPWSPDGKRIAYSVHVPENECILFEPDKAWNEQKLEYLPPLGDASISFEGWSWSPSGTKLAGIKHLPNGVHSGIGIYDLASKSYDWLTDFGDWPVWLNDDRRLLFVSGGKIFLFDTRTRKPQQILTVTDQDIDIGSPGLSPDNRTLYFTFVAAEADIWLMTLE